ncbi:gamma-glutamyl-gamma-aminobutyrate hydrolase family protein [Terriglobus roseus]|uniref:Putative glutamine amidotransferase n=1 Tax=Terriglobus roseus TaxID=392734 RepID=A0A1G7PKQ9_9BACT|nr:gamma-glutamyl-gamma-aminobutyrate hydrolase family protein [Terriglobus roseus]SDF86847.1 putative glutamine amidotransferase [Terriglobus roseus]
MNRPRILIPIPTSFDESYNAKSWPEYASAVEAAGGEPVKVTLTHSVAELKEMARQADGILLPGSGADIDPALYGHDRDPASTAPDPLRDQTDRALFEASQETKKPLLGICFGTQSMNVFYGGTLIQDCSPVPVNHRAGRSVAVAHAVQFSQDSRLGQILQQSGESTPIDDEFARVPVNSSHHQAIASPGDTLRVVARCPEDAIIEAVEGSDPKHWLIGVQWHPERTVDSSAASRAIFTDFLKAAAGV